MNESKEILDPTSRLNWRKINCGFRDQYLERINHVQKLEKSSSSSHRNHLLKKSKSACIVFFIFFRLVLVPIKQQAHIKITETIC